MLALSSQLVVAQDMKDHPSPYLRLHADDSVDWQVWGKAVLDRAKAENKLVFLSIGYFSCHWCHVMQKESYQDKQIGERLNEHFIAVKVDRELRPELDRRMIRFVEAVRGQAGWPLNVFITPDGYPVTGFTYLPRDSFYDVLSQLQQEWQQRHGEIKAAAREYFEQTETDEQRSALVTLPDEHFDKVMDAFISQAMMMADELQGGFGSTTKFPSYPQINVLLQLIESDPDIDSDLLHFVRLTLDVMASRHLMDHVNNGFFRYVTDPDWQTPHFEKMLYDNAQLAALYFDAERIWPKQGYADIGLRTIEFMSDFLEDEDGGFNASLSAVDEQNVEGAAYYWTLSELEQVLNDRELETLKKQGAVPADSSQSFQIKPLIGLGSSAQQVDTNRAVLNKLRDAQKPWMPVDNKRLASWNALVLKALLKAEAFSEDEKMAQKSDRLYRYIINNFIDNEKVIRFAGQSQAAETTLADYAQVAHALQAYANARNDKQAEKMAQLLVKQAFSSYYRNGRWIQNTNSLIPGDMGEWILTDRVLQSPVSVLLETVFITTEPDPVIKKQAATLLTRLTRDLLEVPYHYGSAIMLRKKYHPSTQ